MELDDLRDIIEQNNLLIKIDSQLKFKDHVIRTLESLDVPTVNSIGIVRSLKELTTALCDYHEMVETDCDDGVLEPLPHTANTPPAPTCCLDASMVTHAGQRDLLAPPPAKRPRLGEAAALSLDDPKLPNLHLLQAQQQASAAATRCPPRPASPAPAARPGSARHTPSARHRPGGDDDTAAHDNAERGHHNSASPAADGGVIPSVAAVLASPDDVISSASGGAPFALPAPPGRSAPGPSSLSGTATRPSALALPAPRRPSVLRGAPAVLEFSWGPVLKCHEDRASQVKVSKFTQGDIDRMVAANSDMGLWGWFTVGVVQIRLDDASDGGSYSLFGELKKSQIFCDFKDALPGKATIEKRKQEMVDAYIGGGELKRKLSTGYTKPGHHHDWLYENVGGQGCPPFVFSNGERWEVTECSWAETKRTSYWTCDWSLTFDNDDDGAMEGDYLFAADETALKFNSRPVLYMNQGMVGRMCRIATDAEEDQVQDAMAEWRDESPGKNLSGGDALPIYTGYGKKAAWQAAGRE